MELFCEIFFFCKIHKTPVLESDFNEVTGVYPATSLKERTPTQVSSDEFGDILKTLSLQNTSRQLLLFYGKKYFVNKIVKNPLRKGEKMETNKSNHTGKEKNLITIYIKSTYPFTIQKCLYFSFLCFL